MNLDTQRLIALVVETVIEELDRQGLLSLRAKGNAPVAGYTSRKEHAVSGRVVSERIVLEAAARGETTVVIPHNAIVTPLAADTAREVGISLSRLDEKRTGSAS